MTRPADTRAGGGAGARAGVRVGVIGVGGMGAFHATTLANLASVEVVAVADPDPTRCHDVAATVGAAAVSDPMELAGASDLDGVVIASPDETHAELALAAMAAGVAVLCEKPLATSPADARRVVDAEVAIGERRVQVGLMREYDLAHRQLVAAIEPGSDVHHARCVHRNAHTTVRPLERIVRQSIVHDIHSVRFITGAEIVDVTGFGGGATDDSFRFVEVLCRLNSGGLAALEFDDTAFGYEVGVEVITSDGDVVLGAPTRARRRHDGLIDEYIGSDWFARFGDAYAEQDRVWVESIRNGAAVGPTVWDGFAAELVVDAILRSFAGAGTVAVELPERPTLYA